jgi:hypothetical protein
MPTIAMYLLITIMVPNLSIRKEGTNSKIREVEAPAVQQYWKSRCAKTTTLSTIPDTVTIFPGLPLVDVYLEFESGIYFVDQLYLDDPLNRESVNDRLPLDYFFELELQNNEVKVEWPGIFYIVAPDETNPGAAKLNIEAGTLEIRNGCSTHLPILAPFKN